MNSYEQQRHDSATAASAGQDNAEVCSRHLAAAAERLGADDFEVYEWMNNVSDMALRKRIARTVYNEFHKEFERDNQAAIETRAQELANEEMDG